MGCLGASPGTGATASVLLWAQESFAASKCVQSTLSILLSALEPNFVTLRRNFEKCVYSWGRGVGTIP
jgi:hypothetical protein